MTASSLDLDTSQMLAHTTAPDDAAQPLRVVDWAARSLRGARRRVNEDAILVAPALLAWPTGWAAPRGSRRGSIDARLGAAIAAR